MECMHYFEYDPDRGKFVCRLCKAEEECEHLFGYDPEGGSYVCAGCGKELEAEADEAGEPDEVGDARPAEAR